MIMSDTEIQEVEEVYKPAQNIEAEKAVLGCMLIETPARLRALELLERDDFHLHAHRFIFEAIANLSDRGEPVDLITIEAELSKTNRVEVCGGLLYWNICMDTLTTCENIDYYCDLVKECYRVRSLVDIGNDIAELQFSSFDKASELYAQSLDKLYEAQSGEKSDWKSIHSVLSDRAEKFAERVEAGGRINGLLTPWHELNYLTGGFYSGELTLLAARPGVGKTSMAMQVALGAARQGFTTLVFSLEMGWESLGDRMLASETRIDGHAFRTGQSDISDVQLARETAAGAKSLPLYIEDMREITISDLRRRAKQFTLKQEVGLIVIDYTQIILPMNMRTNRVEQVGEVARGLKTLAREMNVPVLALAQLNRGVEQRGDKTPLLSDLRESGSLESESDTVIFIQRDVEKGDKESREHVTGEVEKTLIHVAKQRNGACDTIELAWIGKHTRFENYSKYEEDPFKDEPEYTPPAPGMDAVGNFFEEGR